MRLKFGRQYKIKWIDAFGDSEWTTEEEIKDLLKEHSKPESQTLYFIKSSAEFYIFTSGKPAKNGPYLDIHGIPKGWIVSIKEVK